MKYFIEWLTDLSKTDKQLEYEMFWGHQPEADGKIGSSCLSQWFERSFEVDDIVYPTAEHWMMAEKARTFKDFEILPAILNAKTAEIAKELGRKVKNFNSERWDVYKYYAVRNGNLFKFIQNQDLQDYLLSTGAKILVEASPTDTVWGIGLSADDPDAMNPAKWQGANLLGFALMDVRDELM